ncbi:hypothetical protein DL769_008248 [Monosporascus sp. CRB-8-3]|nr:hypothetical protein DL769_008248 [Monosporascus sp. CRB-8-3]
MLFSSAGPLQWSSVVVTALLAYAATRYTYLLYFHPASEFPGSKLAAASNVCYACHWWQTTRKVVRVAPNEDVFSTPQAALDIYGATAKGHEIWVKTDLMDFGTGDGGFIWEEDPVKRCEVAKKILPAFSTKAIRAKQATVQMYIDLFVDRMKVGGKAARRQGSKSLKFPLLSPLALLFTSPELLELLSKFSKMNSEEIQKRMNNRGMTKHPGFFDYILPADTPAPTSKKQKVHLEQVALQLFIAGFDPVQITYYGCLFFLVKEPVVYANLIREIRTEFQSYSDITSEALVNLEYLQAVIQETFRMYYPGTTGFPRGSPGATVDGVYVPKGLPSRALVAKGPS